MPMEIGWKLWNLPMRVFGDFAVNLEADDRAAAAGRRRERRPALRLPNRSRYRPAEGET